MPPRPRLESLPAELLSGILTLCSRDDLVNLAQACSNLCAVCRKELINYPLIMNATSDNLKSWVVYFRKENTLLTRGARSFIIEITVTMQDLLDAVDDVDPAVFDVDARPIHPDANRILPLPSSLRRLTLRQGWLPVQHVDSNFLLFLLLRSIPERCPYIEELSVEAHLGYSSNEFDECIRRLTHLRKLRLHVSNLPSIPNRLSLLPASLTELYLYMTDIQIQEVATAIIWVRGIRKIAFTLCTPQDTANVLRILSRGGATHLNELFLRENRSNGSPASMMSSQEALTIGLQEFSLLRPPLRTLSLDHLSAWSDSLHLPLLHTAVASTLTHLSLQHVDSCIFPSHLPWPRLQSLELIHVPKMGYQGRLIEPIFPVLTALTMSYIDEIQAPEDFFPALETIRWLTTPPAEQVASLVRHDIKRIDLKGYYTDERYEPLWEAMGGHIIELILLGGSIPEWMKEHVKSGERIFPGFPNIREFTISRG